MKILIVDDHPTNLRVLGALLGSDGHAVVTALNGIEALEVLARQPVDAVISDILMPKMDGYRLCYEVRAREALRGVPFIFYTGSYTSPGDERLCYELGADKYLRKPAAPQVLLGALREAVARPRRAAAPPSMDGGMILREYTERLVNKLEQKNVELLRTEQQLRLIVEHSPAAIALLDRDMRYVVTSRRWLTDYRVCDRDIVGRSHYEVFPDLPARWRDIHVRCLAGATEKCDEDAFPRADGITDWVRWEIRPWRDAHGDIGGLIIFSELITERKRAEHALRESEEHFRALFERSADGIFLLSGADLVCRNANARCSEMMGYPREELVGMAVTRFTTDPEAIVHELAELLQGRPYRKEWSLRRKDGSTLLVELSIAALSNGLIIVTLRDITERRRAEEFLMKRADELERFNRLSIGRELQMIELKQEVNRLAIQAGQPPPYKVAKATAADGGRNG